MHGALVLALWLHSVSDLLEFLFSLLKWKWGDPCPEKRLSPDFLLQVIWNLQLMSMWEMALRPHLGSRMAWSLSLIKWTFLDQCSLEKMFKKIARISKHRWLPLSRELVEIMQQHTCQEPVRRRYTLLAWSDKLCHLSPKLKHRIKVPYQTVAVHVHRQVLLLLVHIMFCKTFNLLIGL